MPVSRPGRLSSCVSICRVFAVRGTLLGALLLAAPGCSPNKAASVPAASGKAAGDVLVLAVRGGLPGDDSYVTFLEPFIDVPVTARVDGVVREVRVHEGQRVAQGAVLARIEDEEQRLEVDYTAALYAQAKAELERAEKGAAGQFVSRQQLDAARAKAEASRVDLDLAKLAYARRTLRAPVAGVVWQVRAEAHRPVTAAEVLFRVTEPARLKADLLLPAALMGSVHVGDVVNLMPEGAPGEAGLTGHVRLVSPIVDPATGRFKVEVEAPARQAALAGQTVRATLAGNTGSAANAPGALLPRGAYLERTDGRLFVFVVRDGVVQKVAVELGSGRPDGYEVVSGLLAGDLVCAAGAVPPAAGTAVHARLAPDTGE
jgi:membrane fusion protein (multidrug efflux system)